jgi:pimeloyl-ACP methyl ester carboxylesterase
MPPRERPSHAAACGLQESLPLGGSGSTRWPFPTTVYYGTEDVMVPAHGAWRADHIPAARAVVDSAGHLWDPDKLVQRLSH